METYFSSIMLIQDTCEHQNGRVLGLIKDKALLKYNFIKFFDGRGKDGDNSKKCEILDAKLIYNNKILFLCKLTSIIEEESKDE
jgi:hypothetical protein